MNNITKRIHTQVTQMYLLLLLDFYDIFLHIYQIENWNVNIFNMYKWNQSLVPVRADSVTVLTNCFAAQYYSYSMK